VKSAAEHRRQWIHFVISAATMFALAGFYGLARLRHGMAAADRSDLLLSQQYVAWFDRPPLAQRLAESNRSQLVQ
jgi:hypothetical protein